MNKFCLGSKYLDNLQTVIEKFEAYKEHKCTIVINKSFVIDLPVVVAASISSIITRTIENDPTADTFEFTINNFIESSLRKIKRVITRNETVIIKEEEDIQPFAEFGLAIGNNDFIVPLNEQIERENSTITSENVLRMLNIKNTFNNRNTKKETSFIAENFDSMSIDEDFIAFSRDVKNLRTIEEIIRSEDLRVSNEDVLMTYLLALCHKNKEKKQFIHLFKLVFLEYCSIETCKSFLGFIDDIVPSEDIRTLVSCLGRRILQPNMPMYPEFITPRHKQLGINIGYENPLKGIINRELEKGNLILETSSKCSDIYNILRDDTCNFNSDNDINCFFKASLRGKTFRMNKYMIRGSNYEANSYKTTSWALEGKRASNGQWFVIDKQSNVSFNQLEVKMFDVKCREHLKAVRFTQTEKNTSDNYRIIINMFDIFGTLYE